jgi:hypothetical protein
MCGVRPRFVGFGGANWLHEHVIIGVECCKRRRSIWLRISPGSSRKRKGIAAVEHVVGIQPTGRSTAQRRTD